MPAGTTTYLYTGLTNDRAYTYALVGVDGHGNRSPSSAAVQVNHRPDPAGRPDRPGGAARGDGSVSLTWTANTETDLAGYRVLRHGVEITWLPAGTTSYLDAGLTDDQTYSYALAAVDTHGNRGRCPPPRSARRRPTSVRPWPPPGSPPRRGRPHGGAGLVAGHRAGPRLDRVLRDGAEVATVAAGTTSFPDTGLTDDVTYTYVLVAVDDGNRSAPSAAARHAMPTDQTAPAAPTGLVATRGDGRVTLSWRPARSPTSTPTGCCASAPRWTVAGTGYVDGGLTNDTPYAYALVAVDTHGNRSAPSAPPAPPRPTSPPRPRPAG